MRSVLGRGGFGVVHGCKKANTGKLLAMKAMNKRRIKVKNAADLCWNERIVLGKVDSPFVISLKYAFQSPEDLYLILDLATGTWFWGCVHALPAVTGGIGDSMAFPRPRRVPAGGDLAFHLSKDVRFPEERARFYAAQILLGLEHLHSLGIVYRCVSMRRHVDAQARSFACADRRASTASAPRLLPRRDLKPENILLDDAGNAKISDLGLATRGDVCG